MIWLNLGLICVAIALTVCDIMINRKRKGDMRKRTTGSREEVHKR